MAGMTWREKLTQWGEARFWQWRLSHWDAWHSCFCSPVWVQDTDSAGHYVEGTLGTWAFTRVPVVPDGRSKRQNVPCADGELHDLPWFWEWNEGQSVGKVRVSAWGPIGNNVQHAPNRIPLEQDGADWRCSRCGYVLSAAPEANIKAIPREVWEAAPIVGAALGREGGPHDPPWGDAAPTFDSSILDNVKLGKATMLPRAQSRRAAACSRSLILPQNDRHDWHCRWGDSKPVQPLDLREAVAQGRNVDPAKLPARMVDETIADLEQTVRSLARDARSRGKELEAKGTHVECPCVARRREKFLASAPTAARAHAGALDLPLPNCRVCEGSGAIPAEVAKVQGVMNLVPTAEASVEPIGEGGVR
jgi:hypothetical protein